MTTILVDTGVWLAIFDERDQFHRNDSERIDKLTAQINSFKIVVPWPIAYETLRTRFVKNRLALEGFEKMLKQQNVIFVDDAPFRDQAILDSIESSLHRRRHLSAVDCVIRLLLGDEETNVRYLATFNLKDFCDVCRTRKIEVLE